MIKFKLKIQLAIHDLNRSELAEKTGIRPSTISALCNGDTKQIPVHALDKICAVLNCQPNDIIEYVADK